jgi:hypothetical protein
LKKLPSVTEEVTEPIKDEETPTDYKGDNPLLSYTININDHSRQHLNKHKSYEVGGQ